MYVLSIFFLMSHIKNYPQFSNLCILSFPKICATHNKSLIPLQFPTVVDVVNKRQDKTVKKKLELLAMLLFSYLLENTQNIKKRRNYLLK